ncbi:hypothetical protein [Bacillus cereus]|uniref:hypothetical protein n=1 Tax=Bacillus cereus TaxID=1396 RepID=UPI0007AB5B68|nr:hypothetical protein [Bacillus cereus]
MSASIMLLIIMSLIIFVFPITLLIWITLGFRREGNIQKKRKVTIVQIVISTILFFACLPMGLFVGGMASYTSSDTIVQFCLGFLFAEGIPLLCLLLSLTKLLIQPSGK